MATSGVPITWTVVPPNLVGSVATLTPGGSPEQFSSNILNTTSGPATLNAVTVTINQDAGGGVVSGGTDYDGCLASWFTATITSGLPTLPKVIPGDNGTGGILVSVSMVESGTNQSACEGLAPSVHHQRQLVVCRVNNMVCCGGASHHRRGAAAQRFAT